MAALFDPLDDPAATTLSAGDLQAQFLPGFGMLGVSLRHKGVEIQRRLDNLPAAAANGSTAGIPLLYPWANRLSATHYKKAGPEVALDRSSPLLHFDANGLPIHGVPWSRLAWEVKEREPNRMTAVLDWISPAHLAIFPYPHRVLMGALVDPGALTIAVIVFAHDRPVPVSFGFHPYIGLPDVPRSDWRLQLPPMRRLLLDDRGIPTGTAEDFTGLDQPLGDRSFDDGFALLDEGAALSISGGGRRVTVELKEGFTHTQVYAPKDQSFIALEPMTAATNALVSGDGLRLVVPEGRFGAAFTIRIGSDT
jgi:aldose 1-epimerase